MKPLRSALAVAALCVGVSSARAGVLPEKSPIDGTEAVAAKVDGILAGYQKKAKRKPSAVCDDATFLRRVTLDLTGTLPEPDAIRAFLLDGRIDKRARAVDALLASPAYAEHWSAFWDDVLMGPKARNGQLDRGAFHRWLLGRFQQNQPYNQFVFDLVSATGQNTVGGEESKPKNAGAPELAQEESQAGVNGAVNWLLKYRDAPQDLAGNTSKVFLGVQIQCAQCHDHKTEKWKQADFRGFAASFAYTKPQPMDPKNEKMEGIKRLEVRDIDHPIKLGPKAPPEWREIAATRPTALDGTDLASSGDPRRALAGWIVSPKNPWFAQELVNRYWGALTGRGFVDPVDDIRPSNPAMAPEAMDLLSRDFMAHGYDLKRLLREIALTDAYQRGAGGQGAVQPGEDFWARGRLRPLTSEQLVNAITEATQLEPALEQRAEKQGKPVAQIKLNMQRDVMFLFDVDEDSSDDDSFTGTVPQALMLLNGGLVNRGVHGGAGTTLDQLTPLPTEEARLELLYLRTLSRRPTAAEIADWKKTISEKSLLADNGGPGDEAKRANKARKDAYEDLFWALINSSEFQFNH